LRCCVFKTLRDGNECALNRTSMVPVNPLEVLNSFVGHGNPDIAEPAPVERRRRTRARVHWPVLLFPRQQGENTVETITQNLSSQGFYCLSSVHFSVGEWLLCTLQVLTNDPGGRKSRLECRAQVVRVEHNAADGQYGIACRTGDYRFTAGQD
jgi:hypothetical protein